MQYLKVAAIAMLILTGIYLQPAIPGEKTGPRIFFPQKTAFLEKLPSGGRAKYNFEFTNKGDETLVVDEIKTSCGCTNAMPSQKEIPPGGSGTIKVTFDSHGFLGNVSKEIEVYTNDPGHPVTALSLKAEVLPTIQVEPKNIDFETIHIQTASPKDLVRYIRVKDMIRSGARVRFAETDIPFLRVGVDSVSGYETRIKARIVPNDYRGSFQGVIKILSDSKFYPILVLLVEGDIKD